MRVNPPFHVISSPAEHPSQPFPKDFLSPNLLFRSSACIDRAVVGGFLPPPRNDTQPDPPNDTKPDPHNDTKPTRPPLEPSSARRTPSPCPILFLCSPPPLRKNFCRGRPQMPFPLQEFVSFGLSSVYKPKYLFPRDHRVHHAVQTAPPFRPGPLRRSGDFLSVRTKTSSRARPFVRGARYPALHSSPILPIPYPSGTRFPKRPFSRSSFETAPVLPARVRLSPTCPAQN